MWLTAKSRETAFTWHKPDFPVSQNAQILLRLNPNETGFSIKITRNCVKVDQGIISKSDPADKDC